MKAKASQRSWDLFDFVFDLPEWTFLAQRESNWLITLNSCEYGLNDIHNVCSIKAQFRCKLLIDRSTFELASVSQRLEEALKPTFWIIHSINSPILSYQKHSIAYTSRVKIAVIHKSFSETPLRVWRRRMEVKNYYFRSLDRSPSRTVRKALKRKRQLFFANNDFLVTVAQVCDSLEGIRRFSIWRNAAPRLSLEITLLTYFLNREVFPNNFKILFIPSAKEDSRSPRLSITLPASKAQRWR